MGKVSTWWAHEGEDTTEDVPSQNVGLSAAAVRMTVLLDSDSDWIESDFRHCPVDFDNFTHSRSPTEICYHTIVAT
jgi:hypothetical protein